MPPSHSSYCVVKHADEFAQNPCHRHAVLSLKEQVTNLAVTH